MAKAWLLYGRPGSLKSTFAANSSGKKWWAEFDLQSLDRARVDNRSLIDSHQYFPPLATMLDLGQLSRSGSGGFKSMNTPTTGGYWNKLQEFNQDLLAMLEGEYELRQKGKQNYQSVVIDTATRLWELCQAARDEQIREAKLSPDAIGQLKFGANNHWMWGYLTSPKAVDVDLFFIEHEEIPFGGTVIQPAGWKPELLQGEMDVVLRFTVEGTTPWAEITKTAGADLSLKGSRVSWPTVSKIEGLLDGSFRQKIETAGLGMPATADEIVGLAGKL